MKTDEDIRREDTAHAVNAGLAGTGIHVSAGGNGGPYSVTVGRLNEREMREVVKVLAEYVDAGRGAR